MIYRVEEGFLVVATTARELATLQELRKDLIGAGIDCDYERDPGFVGTDGVGLLVLDQAARLSRQRSSIPVPGDW